jgi:hypothetical protein
MLNLIFGWFYFDIFIWIRSVDLLAFVEILFFFGDIFDFDGFRNQDEANN